MPPSVTCNCSCPPGSILPTGTLAVGNSNKSKAVLQAQLVKCLPGSITVPDKTVLKTGTYVAPTTLLQVPYVLQTVYFGTPFVTVPIVNITVNDYGNDPAWVVHIRNLTNVSFDLVLKNADKANGVSFAVLWYAVGV